MKNWLNAPNRESWCIDCGYGTDYVQSEENLLAHPTWQLVSRNPVYDENGLQKSITIIWHNTSGQQFSAVVNIQELPQMAKDQGFLITDEDMAKGRFHLVLYDGFFRIGRISWSG